MTKATGKPKGPTPKFDHEEAVELYTEREWSVLRIAAHYGVSDMSIYRVLKARGIELHWTKKRTTCRHGHARVVWAYKQGDKWRCRRCDKGGKVGQVYLVTVADDAAGIFSTRELAEKACPASLDWACVSTGELWVAGEYTIQAFYLDPSMDYGRKL